MLGTLSRWRSFNDWKELTTTTKHYSIGHRPPSRGVGAPPWEILDPLLPTIENEYWRCWRVLLSVDRQCFEQCIFITVSKQCLLSVLWSTSADTSHLGSTVPFIPDGSTNLLCPKLFCQVGLFTFSTALLLALFHFKDCPRPWIWWHYSMDFYKVLFGVNFQLPVVKCRQPYTPNKPFHFSLVLVISSSGSDAVQTTLLWIYLYVYLYVYVCIRVNRLDISCIS